MAVFSRIKVWAYKEKLASADLNAEFDNIITNMTPLGIEDVSANVSSMQTQVDPGGVGSESLATTMAAEIYRLRYMLSFLLGKAQWYNHTGRSLADGALAVRNADLTDNDVNGSRLVDNTIAEPKYLTGSVSRRALASVGIVSSSSSGVFSTASGTPVVVPGLSVSLTSTGRAVVIRLEYDGSGAGSSYGAGIGTNSSGSAAGVYLYRNAVLVGKYIVGATVQYPPSTFNCIDQGAPAATNVYTVQVVAGSSGSIAVNYCILQAYEM